MLLLVALASVGFDALRKRRLPFRPLVVDALALAFAAIVVLYALIPQDALGGHATHKATAYALRHDLAGVGAYFLGRAVAPRLGKRALARPRARRRRRRLGPRRRVRDPPRLVAPQRHRGLLHEAARLSRTARASRTCPENFVYNNGNEQELTRRLISTFLRRSARRTSASSGCCSRRAGAPRCSSSCRPRRASSGRTRAPPCSPSPSGSSCWPPCAGASGRSPPRPPTLVVGFAVISHVTRTSGRARTSRRASSRSSGRTRARAGHTVARAVGGVAPERSARRDQHRAPPPAGLRARQCRRGRVPRARAAQGGRVELHRARRRDRPPRRAALHRVERRACWRGSSAGARARSPRCSPRCCSSRSRPTPTASRGLHTARGGSQRRAWTNEHRSTRRHRARPPQGQRPRSGACVCKGKRYNRETLEVLFKNKSIADVLDMTVEEALDFFKAVPRVRDILTLLRRVGLDYIHVGQQATTLSGGEAQRVKLAKELSKRATGRTLYILDEPTTGLHFHDVAKLLEVLHELVEQRQHRRGDRAQPRGHRRPPTGSSTSAPKAATAAARSSPPARPRTSPPSSAAIPGSFSSRCWHGAMPAGSARSEGLRRRSRVRTH